MIGAMYSGKNIRSYGKKKFLVSFQLIVIYRNRVTTIMLVETDIITSITDRDANHHGVSRVSPNCTALIRPRI